MTAERFGLMLALAVVLPWEPLWSALPFGLLWVACLIHLGLHLRRLGRRQQ